MAATAGRVQGLKKGLEKDELQELLLDDMPSDTFRALVASSMHIRADLPTLSPRLPRKSRPWLMMLLRFAFSPESLPSIADPDFWLRDDVRNLLPNVGKSETRGQLVALAIAAASKKKNAEQAKSVVAKKATGDSKTAAKRKWPDIDHSKEVESPLKKSTGVHNTRIATDDQDDDEDLPASKAKTEISIKAEQSVDSERRYRLSEIFEGKVWNDLTGQLDSLRKGKEAFESDSAKQKAEIVVHKAEIKNQKAGIMAQKAENVKQRFTIMTQEAKLLGQDSYIEEQTAEIKELKSKLQKLTSGMKTLVEGMADADSETPGANS